ncbi:phasin family protein [Tardiphaga alba]|uniref:Phasin family protein n=1 Tax=Tardiphaga alba TaxID=340268 RepID=A0ABX8A9P3_9BRAD|nr:phasin family protein [Tardiphaga alba]QUS40392.1 phasin family protein [Tardiphaga alba]
MFKIEDIQAYGQEHFASALATAGEFQTGAQAIATAVGDYTKKSFEDGNALMSELATVKSLDKAFEVQGDYAKLAYDNFVAEGQKISDLYADLAKQAFKPFEGLMSKMTPGA